MTLAIAPVSPALASSTARAAPDPQAAKLHHAATEFESMFVKQLLKTAKLGGTHEGDSSGGYADMAVDAMASAVERGGGLGLAARIEDAVGRASAGAHAAGHR